MLFGKKHDKATPQWFLRFIEWREQHVSQKFFILLLSIVIGILCAVASFVLKEVIHGIQHYVLDWTRSYNFLYLILPVIGIFLTSRIVKYIVRDDISHGVTRILSAISERKSRLKSHNIWSSMFASSITIGLGGSVGAESPIVMTGSAIGSNLGRLFRMDQKTLMLLLGCGAAGAISGIFKAPITGLVFVLEVLMLDLTMSSVLPLLTSSVVAATMSYILTGTQAMFSFSQSNPFSMERIPYALGLGVVCGLVSLYFTKVVFGFETKIQKTTSYWQRFVICGVILSLLIFLFPPLYGEGYSSIDLLLSGHYSTLLENSIFESLKNNYWVICVFLILTVFFKAFSSTATNSGGGVGGLFAPSLFVGGLTGFTFSYILNYFPFIKTYLPQKNFTVMGMAGVMAAVMHAPLTGVFLIAELTGGYNLFLPLLLVSLCSYATIRLFLPQSIYSLRLYERGKLLTHQKDKAVLTLMNLESVLETNFLPIEPDMSLGEMVKVIGLSTRNIFPVLDEDQKLLGIVNMDEIRNIMFRPELYDRFKVHRFMHPAPAKLTLDMPMEQVMKLFDDHKVWNLPVVDEFGCYKGFVSKSKIFNSYRQVLVENLTDE